eukprot:gene5731-6431_t
MEDNSILIENSVSKHLESLLQVQKQLSSQIEELKVKRELFSSQQNGEMVTVWMMDNWEAADTLRRKEESLMKHKKEKLEIDSKMVDTYEEIVMRQLHRAALMIKKLQGLESNSPNQECPDDLKIASYTLWTKDDYKLNTLQSEILELLGKKIRLTQDILQDKEDPTSKRHLTFVSENLDQQFESVRQMGYSIIEQYSIVDPDFTNLVNQLLDLNGTNFEAMKLLEYIAQCRKDYSETTVESILFPHIADAIKFHTTQSEDDAMLDAQFKLLATTDQFSMGIKEEFIDHGHFPHKNAIESIKKISIAYTPSQKLKYILLAAHEVVQFLNSRCCLEERVPGADEFTDLWVFVILNAKLPQYFTTVSLLCGYSNPRIAHSETGYYLACFELAGEYIKRLSESSSAELSTEQQSKLATCSEQRMYFLPDIERCHEFARRAGHLLSILNSDVTLHGYRLLADLDSQLERGRLFTTLLEEDPSSSVQGILIKPSTTCSNTIATNTLENFIISQSRRLSRKSELICSDQWMIVVRNADRSEVLSDKSNGEDSEHSRYVCLPSGRYSDYEVLLKRFATLERLGCCAKTLPDLEQVHNFGIFNIELIETATLALEEQFMQQHNLVEKRSVPVKMEDIVKDVQTCLLELGFYSKALPIDGVYGSATVHGVRLFQLAVNKKTRSSSEEIRLQENGICGSLTYSQVLEASKSDIINIRVK